MKPFELVKRARHLATQYRKDAEELTDEALRKKCIETGRMWETFALLLEDSLCEQAKTWADLSEQVIATTDPKYMERESSRRETLGRCALELLTGIHSIQSNGKATK